MIIAPLLCLFLALLLIAAAEYLAWDGRRLTAPLEPTHGDAQVWADELDAELTVPRPRTRRVRNHGLRTHIVDACPPMPRRGSPAWYGVVRVLELSHE